MSTMNLGSNSMLSLEKDSKRLSLIRSTTSLNKVVELEQVNGMKSTSEAEMASEAKQKKIDHLVAYAEKVCISFWDHPITEQNTSPMRHSLSHDGHKFIFTSLPDTFSP